MEDNFAYQILDSKHIRAAPLFKYETPESEEDRLKRLYLKTVDASEPDENITELQTLLAALFSSYISGFQIDGRIPYELREIFEKDMDRFSQNLSEELARKYQSALDSGCSPEEAMEQSQAVLKEGVETLSAKLYRYDKDFKALIPLLHYKDEGYDMFLFLSEQGEKTCERCEMYHGKIYSIYNLHSEGVIPPLHPNCRCELIAMDGFAVRMYNLDRRSFLQYFERLRGANHGGIYVLDHDFFRIGLSPDALTRISYPNGTLAFDTDKPFWYESQPDYYEKLENWSSEYFAGLIRQANEMAEALIEAQDERAAVKWDSVGGFLDWLTLGIVSGFWDGMKLRHNAMKDDPSLYNIINAISLGTLDTLRGAVKPEEPWSLQHLLDIVGTVLIAYAAFRTVSKVARVIGGIRAGVPLSQSVIDEILSAPDGHRPDPRTYLSEEYINKHLSDFNNGVTKITAKVPNGTVGGPTGTFVMPTSVADDIIKQSGGNVSKLEELLGFNPGDLGTNPVRIDIANPKGLRIPSGNEAGVNNQWLPGGYTSGGSKEAVVDAAKKGEYTVKPVY